MDFQVFENSILLPLTEQTAEEISCWEYPEPYSAYSFAGRPNGWLHDQTKWGSDLFCLVYGETVLGQVACQSVGNELWVGWSMNPMFCGKGNGETFVKKCVEELKKINDCIARIKLRVAASNSRAISAYRKAGFSYVQTISDEIAYSDKMEDFWVMELV